MLTQEQKDQFSEILQELGNSLDISETQYNAVVKSYQAVGEWLSKDDSLLQPYNPEILPQGSFMLGTMIKPISENDDLDIDLACQLTGKNVNWAQYHLKQKVGDQLKSNDTYKGMIKKPEGRRCWTLEYRKDSENLKERYHMDILPCIVDSGYRLILEKAFTDTVLNVDQLAIRITDKEQPDYYSETNHLKWLKSNPFGYARWFFQQATIDFTKAFSINESIQRVPKHRTNRLPLQRVVQILKRHRDIMFDGHEDKPISIIITTLASQVYNKETILSDALLNIVDKMLDYIVDAPNPKTGKMIKWVKNPVNESENFADKWSDYPQRQANFYKWHEQLKKDIHDILGKQGGLQYIQEAMANPFGKDLITKTFSNYADNLLKQRKDGNLKMASGSGILGAIGTKILSHNFHGK
jgi:hypothetical protein